MRRLLFVFLMMGISFSPVKGSDGIIDEIIVQYKNGNYRQALQSFYTLEEKDARIYYFMGLTYYKAGRKEDARRSFLSTYYLSPDSRWGRAAYKNYRYLTGKKFYFNVLAGLSYDSNVSHLPDIQENSPSALILDASFSAKTNLTGYSSLGYIYSRNQYLSGISPSDSHSLSLKIFKGPAELSGGASYAIVAGDPFYLNTRGELKLWFLRFRAVNRDYLNGEYDYLQGYELSAGVNKNIHGMELGYSYTCNEADDLKKKFKYWQHTGTPEDGEYDFEEIESDKDYALSYTYDAHRITLSRRFYIDGKNSLKAYGAYEMRTYTGDNYWYRDYWIEGSDGAYYWDDKESEWVESDEPAPGIRQEESQRKESRITTGFTLTNKIDRNTSLDLFLEYTLNRSNIEDIASFNYNWSKAVLGARINYGF